MNVLKKLISSILAGGCISLGATAYLAIENPIIGACFFCIGLFIICSESLDLYTGQINYIIQTKDFNIILILIGNILGTIGSKYLIQLAGLQNIINKAAIIVENKLNHNLLNMLILAILCNVCIYIAVEGYKNIENIIGAYLALFFGVSIFIICGFEHCIADCFYFSLAGWTLQSFLAIIIIIIGNTIGGICIHNLHYFIKRSDSIE